MYAERPTRWDTVDRFTDTYSLVTGAAVVVILAAIGGMMSFLSLGGSDIDRDAFSEVIVSHSDLPAPPFTGWTRSELEDPVPASNFAGTDQWDEEECRPGSDSYEGLDAIIAQGQAWSGAAFYNAALDNTITVQVASSREGDMTNFGGLRDSCETMTGSEGSQEYSGSLREMPDVDFKKLNFSTGREWVTEHSVYEGDDLVENRSTAVVLATDGETKVQVSITIPGSMEDNAIRSMELVLRLQAAKITAMNSAESAPADPEDDE